MNASEDNRCQRCGSEIPPASIDTLCPACLLSGALEPSGDQTVTVTMAPGGPHSLYGPSKFPCEFGEYRLLGLLGRGGMGAVYEAEHRPTGRRLALKMLGQRLDTPEMRQRFLREGRLAARVNHPNSLYVFGSEEIEGHPVITMEIAGGGTLKDKLKKRGRLPVADAVDAVLDVIAGLESALASGVLHRDVKPSNCFVAPDGSVKVGDFGLSVSTLAKTDSFVTADGMIMGTPAYASPEQLRGDTLDVHADIYSVGATLFTLLTGRAPFEGNNVVQVVANAVNQKPPVVTELSKDVPPGLDRIVAKCLAKEPSRRFSDYVELRNALLPYSSREPEPASMLARTSAGWIDYLIAFLPAYVTLMLLVGVEGLLVRPVVEPSLYSARYYLLLFGLGLLYFTVLEGIWGAGLGKWLKGLQVIRVNGNRPGVGRAFLRILIPILAVEGVRMPLMMVLMPEADWSGVDIAMFIVAANVCGWIPVVLTLRARRENGFATVWDSISGTKVVVKPKGSQRQTIEGEVCPAAAEGSKLLGPYRIIEELVPGKWIIADDPVLRRRVWLLRRTTSDTPRARREIGRPGRPRWLQAVADGDTVWDAFDAAPGLPFRHLAGRGKQLPWATLRQWLHDLASELWSATGDQTLPADLSIDHIWITEEGRAVLLDEPWPGAEDRAESIPVGDLASQQRFLSVVAEHVESTSLPTHAAPVLRNLRNGNFEKLSFVAGTLRGLLDKPATVSRGVRAGSIFMLPLYIWIAIFVGRYSDAPWEEAKAGLVFVSAGVLSGAALIQLLSLWFRTTVGQFIFRLAVVNAKGESATRGRLASRWAIIWLPLIVPFAVLALARGWTEGPASVFTIVMFLLWITAATYAVVDPRRGLHDRLAGTWVVRR